MLHRTAHPPKSRRPRRAAAEETAVLGPWKLAFIGGSSKCSVPGSLPSSGEAASLMPEWRREHCRLLLRADHWAPSEGSAEEAHGHACQFRPAFHKANQLPLGAAPGSRPLEAP